MCGTIFGQLPNDDYIFQVRFDPLVVYFIYSVDVYPPRSIPSSWELTRLVTQNQDGGRKPTFTATTVTIIYAMAGESRNYRMSLSPTLALSSVLLRCFSSFCLYFSSKDFYPPTIIIINCFV